MDKDQFLNLINELEINKITSFIIYYNTWEASEKKENKIEFNI